MLYRVDPFLGNGRKEAGSQGNNPCATTDVLLQTEFSTEFHAENL
jgi:hypothetical protein